MPNERAEDRKLPEYLMQNTGAVLSWIAGIVPQMYAAALQPLNIDGRHLAVLMTLDQMGGQVQARLTQITRIDKATMVSLVNDLETASLVERQPHPSDRRAYQVVITEKGRGMIAQADSVTRAATDRFLAALSAEEREHLREMLVRVAQSVTPPDYRVGDPFMFK